MSVTSSSASLQDAPIHVHQRGARHLAMRSTRQHCKSHDRCRPGTSPRMSVKSAALAAITQDAFVPLWRSLVSDSVVALMLHRFADREAGIYGDSPDALRANLEFLRRHRFH